MIWRWGWSVGESSLLYTQLIGECRYLSFILSVSFFVYRDGQTKFARELSWEEIMASSPKTLVLPIWKKEPALHESRHSLWGLRELHTEFSLFLGVSYIIIVGLTCHSFMDTFHGFVLVNFHQVLVKIGVWYLLLVLALDMLIFCFWWPVNMLLIQGWLSQWWHPYIYFGIF